jgi:tRNA-modifying protein YgfZ
VNYLLTDKDLKITSAVLRVRGPDANSYLQGQFTQDLKQSKTGLCYGLWLDQKGKVLADSYIQQIGENEYLVISLTTPVAVLWARLEAYLIADEVELQDETSAWVSVLLWGGEKPVLTLPAGAVELPSRRAGAGAWEIVVPAAGLDGVLAQLRQVAGPGDRGAAELARLKAAMPAVPADLGPRDLPAEGALDEVAISYTKGCYLGQEVMARLKNLGQVRRALHVVGGAGAPPAPGTILFQGERRAGEIRSGAADGDTFLAMAMLSLVQLDPAAPLGLAPGSGGLTILRRV